MIAMDGLQTVEFERSDTAWRNAIMYERYVSIIENVNNDNFDDMSDNVQDNMKDCLKHAQGQGTGRNYGTSTSSIKKNYI